MYLQRVKDALAATDEEWKVLSPKIENIQGLSRQLGGGAQMRMGRGGRMGMGATGTAPTTTPAPAGTQRELTDVEKAVQKLRTTLDNKEAKAEDIKAALKGVREAREKVKEELAKAQGEVRELVTARQEAELVLLGLLD
jgi:peptidoglycan hydrolase CwlO-like protein